jgi:hypothetical protein
MDSLKYTNIEQYYIYYDLTNKPTSRPIRLFVYHLMGLLLVGLSGSKQTMFMNMFVYRTPCRWVLLQSRREMVAVGGCGVVDVLWNRVASAGKLR